MGDTTISFDLALGEFRVLEIEETDDEVVIYVERIEEVGVCPDCHHPSDSVKQESDWRRVQDLPIQGRTVWLKVRVRRYDCPNSDCGKRFSERFESFSGKQRSTQRLRQHMAQTGRKLAHTEAAEVLQKEGVQVTRHLVRQLVLAEAEQIEAPPTEAVEKLGLDDFALKKRNDYATVVTDLATPRVVDVLEGRDKKTIKAYLQKLPWVAAVLVVAMDMWKAYYQAVREAIPQARIVIDKWHVMKHVNEALDKVRKRLQKQAPEGQKQALYEIRGYLWRNPRKLTRKQRRKLNRVLAQYPELATAYELKCRFWRWYDYQSLGWAQKRLTEWCADARASGSPELEKAAGTMETWREPILNYFRERVTNGYTEGINTKIKCIKRRGYGGNRFAHLRKRILLEAA